MPGTRRILSRFQNPVTIINQGKSKHDQNIVTANNSSATR